MSAGITLAPVFREGHQCPVFARRRAVPRHLYPRLYGGAWQFSTKKAIEAGSASVLQRPLVVCWPFYSAFRLHFIFRKRYHFPSLCLGSFCLPGDTPRIQKSVIRLPTCAFLLVPCSPSSIFLSLFYHTYLPLPRQSDTLVVVAFLLLLLPRYHTSHNQSQWPLLVCLLPRVPPPPRSTKAFLHGATKSLTSPFLQSKSAPRSPIFSRSSTPSCLPA